MCKNPLQYLCRNPTKERAAKPKPPPHCNNDPNNEPALGRKEASNNSKKFDPRNTNPLPEPINGKFFNFSWGKSELGFSNDSSKKSSEGNSPTTGKGDSSGLPINPIENLMVRSIGADETPNNNPQEIQTESLLSFFESIIYDAKSKISIHCINDEIISENLPFSELKLCTKFPAIVKEMFEKEIVNLNVSEISSLMLKIILQNKVSTG